MRPSYGEGARAGGLAVRAPGALVGGRHLQPQGAVRHEGRALARALGWFSVGLGLAQVLAPRRVARLTGLPDDEGMQRTMRLFGLRELMSGVGLLTRPRPISFAWARVGGDLIDAALLGRELALTDQCRARLATGLATVGLAGALDVTCAVRLGQDEAPTEGRGMHVTKAITINRPVDEVRQAFGALHDRRGDLDLLRRLAGRGRGGVSFREAPGGRGTEVCVSLEADVFGGKLGEVAAKLRHNAPDQRISEALRALKALVETGVEVCSDATLERGKHPAQPTAGERRGRRERPRSGEPRHPTTWA